MLKIVSYILVAGAIKLLGPAARVQASGTPTRNTVLPKDSQIWPGLGPSNSHNVRDNEVANCTGRIIAPPSGAWLRSHNSGVPNPPLTTDLIFCSFDGSIDPDAVDGASGRYFCHSYIDDSSNRVPKYLQHLVHPFDDKHNNQFSY